jgi:hypothetical protein
MGRSRKRPRASLPILTISALQNFVGPKGKKTMPQHFFYPDFHFVIRNNSAMYYYPQYPNLDRRFSMEEAKIMTPSLNVYDIVNGKAQIDAKRYNGQQWYIALTSWNGTPTPPPVQYVFDCLTGIWHTKKGEGTPPVYICKAYPIKCAPTPAHLFSQEIEHDTKWAAMIAQIYPSIFTPK